MRWIGLASAALALWGCALPVTQYQRTFADQSHDQPWAGAGERAAAKVRVKADFIRLDQCLVWTTPDGRELDADRAVERCERFLSGKGIEREPAGADEEGRPMPAAAWGSGGEALLAPVQTYPDSPVIVCVDPLIVVVCDQPRSLRRQDETPGVMDQEGRPFVRAVRHTLTRGYQYGTGGACAASLRWFAPDLGVGPEPLPSDGAIRTPWGTLVVSRTPEGWTSSALPNAAP
ncbi:MAG: hypothetical protein FJ255_04115 [Phycisphaerae bacterium]|nr:hypothetical protein [Phycisphaerae bacterium]